MIQARPMALATGGGAPEGMAALSSLAAARDALLARRRAQAGRATLGDEHDRALLAALGALPGAAAPHARACGADLGAHVYSRRFFEDHLGGAVAILSASLLETGAGPLRMLDAFHRSARLEHTPLPPLAGADAAVRGALLEGVLEGFLASAFNCRVSARSVGDERYHVELLEGNDVNRRGAA